jgi:hypothetical protein
MTQLYVQNGETLKDAAKAVADLRGKQFIPMGDGRIYNSRTQEIIGDGKKQFHRIEEGVPGRPSYVRDVLVDQDGKKTLGDRRRLATFFEWGGNRSKA